MKGQATHETTLSDAIRADNGDRRWGLRVRRQGSQLGGFRSAGFGPSPAMTAKAMTAAVLALSTAVGCVASDPAVQRSDELAYLRDSADRLTWVGCGQPNVIDTSSPLVGGGAGPAAEGAEEGAGLGEAGDERDLFGRGLTGLEQAKAPAPGGTRPEALETLCPNRTDDAEASAGWWRGGGRRDRGSLHPSRGSPR